MLSECLRAEFAGAGIGVTAICPGIVNTNITRTTHMVGVDAEQERAMQERGASVYERRGYPPEKVAAAIVARQAEPGGPPGDARSAGHAEDVAADAGAAPGTGAARPEPGIVSEWLSSVC